MLALPSSSLLLAVLVKIEFKLHPKQFIVKLLTVHSPHSVLDDLGKQEKRAKTKKKGGHTMMSRCPMCEVSRCKSG